MQGGARVPGWLVLGAASHNMVISGYSLRDPGARTLRVERATWGAAVRKIGVVTATMSVAAFLSGGPIPPATSATQAWPMFQHDLRHTGRTSLVGPSSPGVRWTFALAREPGSPVTGADGTIYLPTGSIQDGDGFLYAINPNGTQKWRLALPGGPASTAPALGPDGTIYLHMNGGEGNLFATDRMWAVNPDGTLKWEAELGGAFTSGVISSPAVAADDTVWVGSMNTVLYALSAADGSLICGVSPTDSSISSSPAIAPDGTVYVIDSTTTLFAIEPDCDVRWGFQLADGDGIAGGNDQSPAIAADGTVWAPSLDESVYAVNPNGTLKCRFDLGESIVSSPAIGADGTVYVSADGLYAINPGTCTRKWRFAPFGSLFSSASPIVDGDGTIYARAGFGALYAVTPGGAKRWSLAAEPVEDNGADPTAVISVDGLLYVADGGLFGSPTRLRAIEARCVVPKVKGKRLARAKRLVEKSDCSVGRIRRVYSAKVGKRRVIRQRPGPGTVLPAGGKVTLVVSKGKRPG